MGKAEGQWPHRAGGEHVGIVWLLSLWDLLKRAPQDSLKAVKDFPQKAGAGHSNLGPPSWGSRVSHGTTEPGEEVPGD